MKRWLEDSCRRIQPQARVSIVPFWLLSVVATLTRNPTLRAVVKLMKYFEGQPEHGDPTEADRILGAPTITLEQWVSSLQASKQEQASAA
jgi:hypothetical protein